MSKKIIGFVLIGFVVVAGLAFYAGKTYAMRSKVSFAVNQGQSRFSGQMGASRGGRMGAMGGGFNGGKIISISGTSMTIQGRDGSSKVVFFKTDTPVTKMVAGANADVVVGKDVTINGTPNPDGSITAESIQIRSNQ